MVWLFGRSAGIERRLTFFEKKVLMSVAPFPEPIFLENFGSGASSNFLLNLFSEKIYLWLFWPPARRKRRLTFFRKKGFGVRRAGSRPFSSRTFAPGSRCALSSEPFFSEENSFEFWAENGTGAATKIFQKI